LLLALSLTLTCPLSLFSLRGLAPGAFVRLCPVAFFGQPKLFFFLATKGFGPSGFLCAAALLRLGSLTQGPFFRLGLRPFLGKPLLLFLPAPLLSPSGFLRPTALRRFRGFAPGAFGSCAFLGLRRLLP